MPEAKIQFVGPLPNKPRLVAKESALRDRSCGSAPSRIPDCSEHSAVRSQSNIDHGTEKARFASGAADVVVSSKGKETADATQFLPTDQPSHLVEEMFQLADIFAAIFEQRQAESKRAIAITAGDGLPSQN